MMNFKKVEFNGFIGIFDNFFDAEFIDELLKYYKKLNSFPLCKSEVPKHWKDDTHDYLLDPNRIYEVNPYFVSHFLKTLWNDVVPIYAEKFSILQETNLVVDQVKIKKISQGGGFHQWHYESLKKDSRRKLVFQLYLNDITNAGETEFLYQNLRFQPKRNRLLVWPADWTYTHRGNPPLDQTDKFILTTWLREYDLDESK